MTGYRNNADNMEDIIWPTLRWAWDSNGVDSRNRIRRWVGCIWPTFCCANGLDNPASKDSMFILSLGWVYKAVIPSMFHSHFGLLPRMSAIPAAIQSLLTLLGSCSCSSSHRHVVSVHHGDGSVECHPSAAPVPDTTLLRWKLFPEATKPVLKMTFNGRKKYFLHRSRDF